MKPLLLFGWLTILVGSAKLPHEILERAAARVAD